MFKYNLLEPKSDKQVFNGKSQLKGNKQVKTKISKLKNSQKNCYNEKRLCDKLKCLINL